MNHQYESLRSISDALKVEATLTMTQREIWHELTKPANIAQLLDTVEAEINQLKERENSL